MIGNEVQIEHDPNQQAGKFYAPASDIETRYQIDKWCDFYTDCFRNDRRFGSFVARKSGHWSTLDNATKAF